MNNATDLPLVPRAHAISPNILRGYFDDRLLTPFYTQYTDCLDVMRDNSLGCEYNKPVLIYSVFSVVSLTGLTNNVISFSIFSHPKYDFKLIAVLMKLLYVINAVFTATCLLELNVGLTFPPGGSDFEEIIKRTVSIPKGLCLFMATGIRAWTEVLKYWATYDPNSDAPTGRVESVVMTLVFISVTLLSNVLIHARMIVFGTPITDPLDAAAYLSWSFLAACVIVFVKLARQATVWRRFSVISTTTSSTTNDHEMIIDLLVEYTSWTSAAFLVAALLSLTYMALPLMKPEGKTECGVCRAIMENADLLVWAMSLHAYWDNFLLLYLGKEYRQEFKEGFKKYMCPFMVEDVEAMDF